MQIKRELSSLVRLNFYFDVIFFCVEPTALTSISSLKQRRGATVTAIRSLFKMNEYAMNFWQETMHHYTRLRKRLTELRYELDRLNEILFNT